MSIDIDIMEIASGQLGLITADQLRQIGATRSHVRFRVSKGLLTRELPRVYKAAGAPSTWRQRLLAGLLSLGDRAVVSHLAAAALHRFDGFAEGSLEYTVHAAQRTNASFAVVHKTSRWALIDRTVVDRIFACTSASRTIIDLAASGVAAARLGDAIDSAVRDGLSSPTFLRKRIAVLRGPGVHGVPRLDGLMIDAGGHSHLERRFLRLMRENGLPRPRTQVIHARGGRTFARVDFEFAPLPLVVEVSGRRGHVTETDRIRDAQRRNELQGDGFVVLEYVTTVVMEAHPRLVTEVREHIEGLRKRA